MSKNKKTPTKNHSNLGKTTQILEKPLKSWKNHSNLGSTTQILEKPLKSCKNHSNLGKTTQILETPLKSWKSAIFFFGRQERNGSLGRILGAKLGDYLEDGLPGIVSS